MKKYLLAIIIFYLTLQIKAQTVSDVDGNTYNTVTIGTQIWMKENLKATKFNDGKAIPNVTGATEGNNTNSGYSWYNNDAATYKNTYGALYNWYTVNTGKLCPTGWHVPSANECTTLITYLGGVTVAGGKLKETGTTHWKSPNTADNSSDFTALPGGWHDNSGSFFWAGSIGLWWSSNENEGDKTLAKYLIVSSSDNGASIGDSYDKRDGLSVRCLKDNNTSSINNLDEPAEKVIYPNPAKDRLFLKNIKSSDATIAIFDLLGKQIGNNKIVSNYIDISGLSKGIYFVKIVDSGNIVINKLIKE